MGGKVGERERREVREWEGGRRGVRKERRKEGGKEER